MNDKYEKLRNMVDDELEKICIKHDVSTSIRSYYGCSIKSIQFNISRKGSIKAFNVNIDGFNGMSFGYTSEELKDISNLMIDLNKIFPNMEAKK